MKKIPKDCYFELAVFCMDYHSGQQSRGYRLLSRLKVRNFSQAFCDECRESEMYQYLVANYEKTI